MLVALPLIYLLIRYLMLYHSAMNLILPEHRVLKGGTVWLFFIPGFGTIWLGIFIIAYAISLERGISNFAPKRHFFKGLSIITGINLIYVTIGMFLVPELLLFESDSSEARGFEIILDFGLVIWHAFASLRELKFYANLHGFTVYYKLFA